MDYTEIINSFIALAAAIVSAVVIPYIKQKLSAGKMDSFLKWVDIFVRAAEQLYDKFDGNEKKQYVIEALKQRGFIFDESVVDSAIEASVLRLHNELYGTDTNFPEV